MREYTLFNQNGMETISIDEVAYSLNVSIASVRNWIRTGYLEKYNKTSVTSNSFNTFKNEILGSQKLTNRANKSLKDNHNHSELESKITEILNSIDLDIQNISDFYENSLSESFKNKEGIFYTPKHVVKKFFEYLPKDCSNLTFCDPCCGSGNFLVGAIEHGFKPSNIYGFDVDNTATKIARKRMKSLFKESPINITNKDFLKDFTKWDKKFDVIMTNPPWGKKLPKTERQDLADYFLAGNSKDTSAIFFLASLNMLKPSGYLGFLLQEAFFNIASYETVRKRALNNKIISLIDFDKAFEKLLTKANGIVLKSEKPNTNHNTKCVSLETENDIQQKIFENNPKSIFNFSCSKQDFSVINHILDTNHHTLKEFSTWGLGIVTGNNKKYCSSTPKKGYIPIWKGVDITKDGLKEPSNYIPADLSLYQQVAPASFYEAKEKLVYKFISSKLTFVYDTNQRYFLNSANILIIDEKFPITHEQLCSILNSNIMTWLFQKLFNTHKVLRADLESLPIITDYFLSHTTFCEETFLDYLSIEKTPNGSYRIKGQMHITHENIHKLSKYECKDEDLANLIYKASRR